MSEIDDTVDGTTSGGESDELRTNDADSVLSSSDSPRAVEGGDSGHDGAGDRGDDERDLGDIERDHGDEERDLGADAFYASEALEDGIDEAELTLFEGDNGTLTFAQRRCLVHLLADFTITAEQDPADWATLLRDRALITSRLHDLFLDLHVDEVSGVAFKIQVRTETAAKARVLLKDGSYTREETVLMVHLRQKHLAERAGGAAHVVVYRDECLEQIALYRPDGATNVAGDRDRAERAVKTAERLGILQRTADPERFIVTNVIEALLPLDQLRSLLDWFREQNSPTARFAAVPLDGSAPQRDSEGDDEENA